MLIGDILLRHLYQVYDFENQTISLGVNTHSEGNIKMYDAKAKPADALSLALNVHSVDVNVEA